MDPSPRYTPREQVIRRVRARHTRTWRTIAPPIQALAPALTMLIAPDLSVKVAHFLLTLDVKIGYNFAMLGRILSLLLRVCLIAALWAFVWRLVEPRTQLMRILRAALLLLGLLGILAAIRVTGG